MNGKLFKNTGTRSKQNTRITRLRITNIQQMQRPWIFKQRNCCAPYYKKDFLWLTKIKTVPVPVITSCKQRLTSEKSIKYHPVHYRYRYLFEKPVIISKELWIGILDFISFLNWILASSNCTGSNINHDRSKKQTESGLYTLKDRIKIGSRPSFLHHLKCDFDLYWRPKVFWIEFIKATVQYR